MLALHPAVITVVANEIPCVCWQNFSHCLFIFPHETTIFPPTKTHPGLIGDCFLWDDIYMKPMVLTMTLLGLLKKNGPFKAKKIISRCAKGLQLFEIRIVHVIDDHLNDLIWRPMAASHGDFLRNKVRWFGPNDIEHLWKNMEDTIP